MVIAFTIVWACLAFRNICLACPSNLTTLTGPSHKVRPAVYHRENEHKPAPLFWPVIEVTCTHNWLENAVTSGLKSMENQRCKQISDGSY
jgi:hypothetical protein